METKCTTKASANENARDKSHFTNQQGLKNANEREIISPSPVPGPPEAPLTSLDGKPVAPFLYFGGKRRAGQLVWPRFGTISNYVEPFCGSLAMLLAAPPGRRIETVNDANGLLVHFWRSVKADAERVAQAADWPVSEIELESRHAFLVNRSKFLREWLHDPHFYDPHLAGWWVWGACCWIGSGWCHGDGPWISNGVEIRKRQTKLHTANAEIGIRRALPHVGNAGVGLNRRLPEVGGVGRLQFIMQWFKSLCERTLDVRILCGDWSRCVTPSVTVRHPGVTAVFLDPPYGADSLAKGLYSEEGDAAARVHAWCIANGDNPKLRIAVCGYAGEYKLPGWIEVLGKATNGGYGNAAANTNPRRERIWFSPHCLDASQPKGETKQ